MQRTNDSPAITSATAQAFKFLSQLGLREPVVFGEDVDASATNKRSGKVHLQVVAALPEGQNPVASWLRLTQKLSAATRLNSRRAPGEIMPREVMFYNDQSQFGVLIGSTHLHVQVSEKPVAAMDILARQPVEQQVAVHTAQGSLARTETQARKDLRMQLELA